MADDFVRVNVIVDSGAHAERVILCLLMQRSLLASLHSSVQPAQATAGSAELVAPQLEETASCVQQRPVTQCIGCVGGRGTPSEPAKTPERQQQQQRRQQQQQEVAEAPLVPPDVVCPLDKSVLRRDREKCEWVNDQLGVAYPEEDGVPILMPRKARMLAGALACCAFL